jgi:hypothetical protein
VDDMTNTAIEDRIAPDCSGYVGMDHAHGDAVSVSPYEPPAPRRSTEDEPTG